MVLLARRAGRLELRADLLARHPQLTVVVLPADLSDEAEVSRVLAGVSERAGPVDVLVNNAGVGTSALFDRTDWRRTRAVLATNVLAPAQLPAGLVPGMVSRGRGGVLNIGSGAGLTVLPAAAAYSGSKHFVAGFRWWFTCLYAQHVYSCSYQTGGTIMPSDQQLHRDETAQSREARFNLRATAKQDTLIRLAAQATNKTVTDFVLDSASNAAEQVLADRRWFLLDEAAWAAFEDSLERPPVVKPRLRELLADQKSIFGNDD